MRLVASLVYMIAPYRDVGVCCGHFDSSHTAGVLISHGYEILAFDWDLRGCKGCSRGEKESDEFP